MPLMNFNKTVPYVRKKGVAGFFQLIFHNFFDLVMLNLLFIFTSIPVFTLGASLNALNKMTMQMVKDEPTSFFKDYFAEFRASFKDGVISGLVFIASVALTGFAFFYYFAAAKSYAILYVAAVVALICLVLIIFTASFYFPMYCTVQLKKTLLLKNSLILSLSCFSRTILAFIVYIFFGSLLYAFFPYSVPFIALAPISFSALAACCAAYEPIIKYAVIPPKKTDDEE